MKSKNLTLYTTSLLLGLVTAGCYPPPPPPPLTVASSNTPPLIRFYPKELSLTIPPNQVSLSASVWDSEHNASAFLWKQINGPAGANIVTPNVTHTSVTGLSLGVYQFEFTATDTKGLFDKDTITLNVFVPQTGRELIYQNQAWHCNYDCLIYGLAISTIPANTPYLVYIKRDNSNDWILVPTAFQLQSDPYFYNTNNLSIDVGVIFDSLRPTDTPDIKIVY